MRKNRWWIKYIIICIVLLLIISYKVVYQRAYTKGLNEGLTVIDVLENYENFRTDPNVVEKFDSLQPESRHALLRYRLNQAIRDSKEPNIPIP